MNEARSAARRHVLVIGGAGYVGSVLVRRLLERGAAVRVLDALLYGNGAAIAALADHPCFSFMQGDFCDGAAVDAALAGITDVVMLGCLVGDPICKKYPDLARRYNETGTIGVFDRLPGRRIDRFVFTSTCSNYGVAGDDALVTEASPLDPRSLYAETKVNVERHILDRVGRMDLTPTILRLSTAFGLSPRMRFDLTVSEFTRVLTLGRDLLVYDPHTWRPYCHVKDIAATVVQVLESPAERVAGEVFNVGDEANNYTKQMIIDSAFRAIGEPRDNVRYQQGGVDPRNYRVSFEKLRSRLGLAARRTVDGAIDTLVGAVRAGLFDDVDARGAFFGNYVIPSAG
jgi:nucleoside-diphosphate-sugar epimerase